MTIGKVIRIARTIKGYGQSDLAKQAGLVAATVSNIENGGRSPNMTSLNKLGEALDIPAFVLLYMTLSEVAQDKFGVDMKARMWHRFYKEKK